MNFAYFMFWTSMAMWAASFLGAVFGILPSWLCGFFMVCVQVWSAAWWLELKLRAKQ